MNTTTTVIIFILIVGLGAAIEEVARNLRETRRGAVLGFQTTTEELKDLQERVDKLEERLHRK